MGEAFICRRGATQKDPDPVDLTEVNAELDWGRNPDGDFSFYPAGASASSSLSGYNGMHEVLGIIDITRGVDPACDGVLRWTGGGWTLYLTLK